MGGAHAALSRCADTRKTAATDHDGSSMLRDIGMCVLFIVGATLVMWLGFMVVYSKLPVPSKWRVVVLSLSHTIAIQRMEKLV